MALIFKNVTVQIQTALAAAKTITGITKVSEAVITGTHDYSVGDYILIEAVGGMTQINNRVVRVKSVSTTVSFVAEGLNSTNFTAYTSGGTAKKITLGASFDNISQISLPDAAPEEQDVTTIHDDEKQIEFSHDAAQKGTFSLVANPFSAAVIEVQTASTARERRAFLVSFVTGQKALFNAYCTGGSGMDGGVGASGTGQISLTLRNKAQWFSS